MTTRTTRKTASADKPKAPATTKGAVRGKAVAAPDAAAAAPKTRTISSKPTTTPEPAATPAASGKKAAAKPAAAPATKTGTPTPSSRAVVAPAPAAPRSPATTSAPPAPSGIDATRRHQLISEIAYGLYVARGYIGGRDLSDWLQAEAEVDRMLAKSAPEKAGGTD